MRIVFNQVVPKPMQSQNLASSEFWGKTVAFETGQQVLIKAPSGTGKSTFHSYACGIRNDFTGTIEYDGKEFRTIKPGGWAKLRALELACIFQDLKLIPELTVKENLLLKNQLTQKFTEQDILGFLSELGIAEKWNEPCAQLSLGQQQRVAIIRSLLQPFKWLLADEPFSHLDEANEKKAMDLMLSRVGQEKAGFIILSLGSHHGVSFNQTIQL